MLFQETWKLIQCFLIIHISKAKSWPRNKIMQSCNQYLTLFLKLIKFDQTLLISKSSKASYKSNIGLSCLTSSVM